MYIYMYWTWDGTKKKAKIGSEGSRVKKQCWNANLLQIKQPLNVRQDASLQQLLLIINKGLCNKLIITIMGLKYNVLYSVSSHSCSYKLIVTVCSIKSFVQSWIYYCAYLIQIINFTEISFEAVLCSTNAFIGWGSSWYSVMWKSLIFARTSFCMLQTCYCITHLNTLRRIWKFFCNLLFVFRVDIYLLVVAGIYSIHWISWTVYNF